MVEDWRHFTTTDVSQYFRSGHYQNLIIEVGPGCEPVGVEIAKSRHDILVIGVEPHLNKFYYTNDFKKYLGADEPPNNFRYFSDLIQAVDLDELPITGLISFFPSRHDRFGKAVADFVTRKINVNELFSALIVTEAAFNGEILDFGEGFIKGLPKDIKRKLDRFFIPMTSYRSTFPSTTFSRYFEREKGPGKSPGIWVLGINSKELMQLLDVQGWRESNPQ